MKPAMRLKLAVDLLMTLIMMVLFAHHITGGLVHEWLGTGMFALFIIHNVWNINWYKNLMKGAYPPFRILQTVINLLLLICMICLMTSGIIMSGYVFAFLNISGSVSFARELHLAASHWAYILMFLHLGLHWGMITKKTNFLGLGFLLRKTPSNIRTVILRIIALLIAVYGVYAFIRHSFGVYLFLISMYKFYDYAQPKVLYFADCFAMTGLFVYIGHYLWQVKNAAGRLQKTERKKI
jgi:hypothetical protein